MRDSWREGREFVLVMAVYAGSFMVDAWSIIYLLKNKLAKKVFVALRSKLLSCGN